MCVCVWRWDTSHCSWRYVPLCPCRVAGRALRMVYVTLAGAFSPVRVSVPSLLSLSLSSDWLPPCMLLLNTTMTSLPTDLLRPMYEWESERYKERESWREKLAQCLLLCGLNGNGALVFGCTLIKDHTVFLTRIPIVLLFLRGLCYVSFKDQIILRCWNSSREIQIELKASTDGQYRAKRMWKASIKEMFRNLWLAGAILANLNTIWDTVEISSKTLHGTWDCWVFYLGEKAERTWAKCVFPMLSGRNRWLLWM